MLTARVHDSAPRRGFTLSELLVSMALIVFIMVILSEAFTTGVQAFRDLKAVGDLNERLRTASAQLRTDLLAAHFESTRFIGDTYLNGAPDREKAAELRGRYEAIAADAAVLKVQFRQVELRTTHPVGKRILRRIQETLAQIELQAKNMVAVIQMIEDDDDDDGDGSSGGPAPASDAR
jgi:prepilin-type N-terminal cleavage/methylation domain-containing protein